MNRDPPSLNRYGPGVRYSQMCQKKIAADATRRRKHRKKRKRVLLVVPILAEALSSSSLSKDVLHVVAT